MRTDQQRIADLEATIDRLERKLVMLETEVASHARQLEAMRGVVKPIESRGGARYVRRDPVASRATLTRAAANARAGKPVGEGKGAIRSERTRKRLQRERDEINRDEQLAIERGTRGRTKKRAT